MNHVDRHLSLVLPGLLDEGMAQLSSPALEGVLSRAERRNGRAGLEAALFELFGVETPSGQDLPVAAVSYVSDVGHAPAGYCLRADPVHLVPDRDHLVLVDGATLRLSPAEAERLAGELTAHFAEDGWRWVAPVPTRWYLTLPEAPALRTYPLAMASGKAIGEFLPLGGEGKRWHGIMNEVQMLLHASEVNRHRLAMGQIPVSSVWFWGGGCVPAVGHSRWSQVWSNEPVSLGLAELSCTPRSAAPADADAWLHAASAPGEHLLVLEDLSLALRTGAGDDAQAALHALQAAWLAPLCAALRGRRLNSLTLYACNGRVFHLTRAGLRRWWRRRLPLRRYL